MMSILNLIGLVSIFSTRLEVDYRFTMNLLLV